MVLRVITIVINKIKKTTSKIVTMIMKAAAIRLPDSNSKVKTTNSSNKNNNSKNKK